MRDDLKIFLRLLRLSRRYWGWMALGALLSTVTVLANIGLLAVAGWFLAAMAVAGVAGILINYFLPSALIRLFAILRAGGRYLERLVTHEATFRLLSELRVWFYEHLEPLAPARLQHYRGSDLLSRIQADIDTLHHAYLRVLVPVLVAVIGVAVVITVLSLYSSPVALLVLSLLLAVGVAMPLIMRRAGERSGAWVVETRAALRATLVDSVQGMGELRVYGAAQRQAQQIEHLTRRISARADALEPAFRRLGGIGRAVRELRHVGHAAHRCRAGGSAAHCNHPSFRCSRCSSWRASRRSARFRLRSKNSERRSPPRAAFSSWWMRSHR